MNRGPLAQLVAVALLVPALAGCLTTGHRPVPQEQTSLTIDKRNPNLEAPENATLISPAEAERRVPFFVEALRTADREGRAGLHGDQADATFSYLKEKSWRGYVVEFEGSYFYVGQIGA